MMFDHLLKVYLYVIMMVFLTLMVKFHQYLIHKQHENMLIVVYMYLLNMDLILNNEEEYI
jgi:hypothetical protein